VEKNKDKQNLEVERDGTSYPSLALGVAAGASFGWRRAVGKFHHW
jgi:hypothetical protein